MKELIELIPTYILSAILCILWRFRYEKEGVKDSMTIAMESTIAFVGLPIKVHLN